MIRHKSYVVQSIVLQTTVPAKPTEYYPSATLSTIPILPSQPTYPSRMLVLVAYDTSYLRVLQALPIGSIPYPNGLDLNTVDNYSVDFP